MTLRHADTSDAVSRVGRARMAQSSLKVFNRTRALLRDRLHVPTATYRLQFNRYFTFQDAKKIADYLQRLGISDIYASPYFKARADSLHGYDIANHNELNPSIGSEADFNALVDELHRLGLYQILDTVPNHMGIGEESNIWWTDVLENGRSSLYAPYFDIDWEPLNPKLQYKVLLPVLGDQYGRVLENAELQIHFLPNEGRFVLRYWENSFPIDPRSYETILNIDKANLLAELNANTSPDPDGTGIEYQSILTAISHLPDHRESDPEKAQERSREKEVIKKRLAALCTQSSLACGSIERGLAVLNGTKGDPRTFDLLDAVLEQQPYRLSFWRVATEEINYRRFFDVNDLAAVQVDRPEVFEATHKLIMRLLRDGKVNGLRVDHVDGLRDPEGYMVALQQAYVRELCTLALDELNEDLSNEERSELELLVLERFESERASNDAHTSLPPLYLVIEKILGRGESLPAEWPVYGTTGYEYTNAVNALFVNSANAGIMDDIYSTFIGDRIDFEDLVYNSKKEIMRLALSSEVNVLTNMLNRISEQNRLYRDFTISGLRNAIREVIACFSVYRTYITPGVTEPSSRDTQVIESAVAEARRRNPAVDPSVFNFLRDILLLRGQNNVEGISLDASPSQARWDFVMKFQQVTGPVTAKGIEDTAFYIYSRLLSLNEVGGEPDIFGLTPDQFHAAQSARLQRWPHAMLTTSTHDTKRSEDVRARINALSEMPREWRTAVRRWARLNRKHKRKIDGHAAPDANEEYFFYQNLLGVWPFGEEISASDHAALIERMQAYMAKALNEAKVHTSWVNTNEDYITAVSQFVAGVLRRDDTNRFLADFVPFQHKIARLGAFNSLSQTILKLTSPGVPDIYQGSELWDFSLVDPDNRRPVDYALRRRLLAQVERISQPRAVAALLDTLQDGRIKLFATSRTLRFRNENQDLFSSGSYLPLEAEGTYANSVVAYARRSAHKTAIVVVPRLISKLLGSEGLAPTGDAWANTRLLLPSIESNPPDTSLRNIFTGEEIAVQTNGTTRYISLSDTFSILPFALLETI